MDLGTEVFSAVRVDDARGVYVLPTGNVDTENCIDFKVTFSAAADAVTGHCLEMVHVPTGAFYLGGAKSYDDRNTINTSRGSLGAPLNAFFAADADGAFNGAYPVRSESAIEIGACDGCLHYLDAQIPGVNTYSGDGQGQLRTSFPKGFEAFYQMRYELSEQQYCDFLNSLTPDQARQRIDLDLVFQGGSRRDYGNFIEFADGQYVTSRPRQACSFISWSDGLAYADWAGLRIMTELEYEKSARGFAPPKFREYVWGSSELEDGYVLDKTVFRCAPDQLCVDGNVLVNLLGFSNYRDVCGPRGSDPAYVGCRTLSSDLSYRGPLAVGIHARGKTDLTRQASGGSYFGALGLSGNLREPVVPVGDVRSRQYAGETGDGQLDESGAANVPDWFYADGEDLVYGYRGGCWAFHENHARIADRFNTYRKDIDVRKPYSGFRGVKD